MGSAHRRWPDHSGEAEPASRMRRRKSFSVLPGSLRKCRRIRRAARCGRRGNCGSRRAARTRRRASTPCPNDRGRAAAHRAPSSRRRALRRRRGCAAAPRIAASSWSMTRAVGIRQLEGHGEELDVSATPRSRSGSTASILTSASSAASASSRAAPGLDEARAERQRRQLVAREHQRRQVEAGADDVADARPRHRSARRSRRGRRRRGRWCAPRLRAARASVRAVTSRPPLQILDDLEEAVGAAHRASVVREEADAVAVRIEAIGEAAGRNREMSETTLPPSFDRSAHPPAAPAR